MARLPRVFQRTNWRIEADVRTSEGEGVRTGRWAPRWRTCHATSPAFYSATSKEHSRSPTISNFFSLKKHGERKQRSSDILICLYHGHG